MSDSEKIYKISVAATMNQLKQADPMLYKEMRSRVKDAAQPIIALAQSKYPQNPTGSERNGRPTWSSGGRLGYDIGKVRSGIVPVVGGLYDPQKNVQRVLSIRQKNAGGVVYDMAGKTNMYTDKKPVDRLGRRRAPGTGAAFVRALASRASRVMWPSAEARRGAVETAIKAAAVDMAKKLNPRLASKNVQVV